MKKILNFLIGASIIFSIQYFCVYLLKILHVSFPAPILGIIVLFTLLKTGVVKENLIKDFCNLILKYMILFFIPLFVGIISYFDLIAKNFWAIIFTIFATTILTLAAVGLYAYNAIKFKRFFEIKKRRKI